MRPLGKNQIDTLKRFSDGPHAFVPTRRGLPWPTMRSLAARGLMWVEKRESRYWHPRRDGFAVYRLSFFAGLTPDGQKALGASIRQEGSNA